MAMRLGNLDLNLLIALEVLLKERSVTVAAERLCLSQSAVSNALSRLRDYFGDPLLILRGRQLFLTTRAEELREPIQAILDQIRQTVVSPALFDPATCQRMIRLMASDYAVHVLLGPTIAAIASEAPSMTFDLLPIGDDPARALERGEIDVLVALDYAISPDHPSTFLYADDYVVVGCARNGAMQGPLTHEGYFALGHVTARFGRSRAQAFDDRFIMQQRGCRRIEVTTPSFLSLPDLLVGTQRVATMLRQLARKVVTNYPLVAQALPFEVPPIQEAIQWNLADSDDKAIRWVVQKFIEASHKLIEDWDGVAGGHLPIAG